MVLLSHIWTSLVAQLDFPDGEEEEEESQAQESRDETLPKQSLKDKTGTDSNSTESSENSTGGTIYLVLIGER